VRQGRRVKQEGRVKTFRRAGTRVGTPSIRGNARSPYPPDSYHPDTHRFTEPTLCLPDCPDELFSSPPNPQPPTPNH
jgi:hypothetical protein